MRDDPWDALSREIDRSRRYRHALTLVRVTPDESSGHRSLAARLRREGRPGEAVRRLETELLATLRSGDCAWSDGSAVFLLLPETDATGAGAMLARVRATATAFAAGADYALASFPEHGVTSRALRAAVTRRFRPDASGAPREWRVLPELPTHPAHPPGTVPGGAD